MLSPVRALPIDERTAAEVAAQVRELLPHYVPGWQTRPKSSGDALVRVFGRFCELIINRLNQAPEKNFLAFLDFLGAQLLPPQPASVPLTFYLAQKAEGATVPAGTQVAAPPPAGEREPVVFETEQNLQLIAASLDSLFVKDPARDTYTDGARVVTVSLPSAGTVVPERRPLGAFSGEEPIPHILYVGLDLPLAGATLKELRLRFSLEQAASASPVQRSVTWEAIQGTLPPANPGNPAGSTREDQRFIVTALNPASDGTANLTTSGEVVFENFLPMAETEVNGVPSRWIRCRFGQPGAKENTGAAATTPAESRKLKDVRARVEIARADLHLDRAFANAAPVDLTKEFFPFGQRPKLGDTLYLASHEAFSSIDSAVTLHFELLNPASGPTVPPILPAHPRATKLIWEFWAGEEWARLGTSDSESVVRVHDETTEFSDGTRAFSETGDVSFKFPSSPQITTVNGQANCWVRVRIVSGDYGAEAHWEQDAAKGYVAVPPSLAPPILAKASVSYTIQNDTAPNALMSYENFRYTAAWAQGLEIFRAGERSGPALYIGFASPPGKPLSSNVPTVYFGLANFPSGKAAIAPSSDLSPLRWEYWSPISRAWRPFAVRDGTDGFRRSGVIPFLVPPEFSPSTEFGRERYWVRAVQSCNTGNFEPQLLSVLLNTTVAVEGLTVENEVLGSSNGQPDQTFRTTRTPVLEGQVLEVLEPTMPSIEATDLLRSDEGEDAVSRRLHPFSKREEIWIRWHAVPNFYASGPQNRHYVLDRLKGEVKFGDGEHGRIPPALAGNIVMRRYRSGGGTRGNKPTGSIAQLRSTIPYVERATNLEPAGGGADAETRSELLERAPRGIRHKRRAVTAEDYEDVALLASPGVDRALCVPLRDLAADPDGERPVPGVVSLIVVPRSTDPRPLPSLELCDRVRNFLDQRRSLTADLVLVAAEYVAIRVEAELAVKDPNAATDVERSATDRLREFLHPLTGRHGAGWEFGRLPAESDLYPLLESIQGVSHVRQLRTTSIPDRTGAEMTSRFLICSHQKHSVTVTLEE